MITIAQMLTKAIPNHDLQLHTLNPLTNGTLVNGKAIYISIATTTPSLNLSARQRVAVLVSVFKHSAHIPALVTRV